MDKEALSKYMSELGKRGQQKLQEKHPDHHKKLGMIVMEKYGREHFVKMRAARGKKSVDN